MKYEAEFAVGEPLRAGRTVARLEAARREALMKEALCLQAADHLVRLHIVVDQDGRGAVASSLDAAFFNRRKREDIRFRVMTGIGQVGGDEIIALCDDADHLEARLEEMTDEYLYEVRRAMRQSGQ